MAEARTVEHEFTKPEVCLMGLIVGWNTCAGRQELGMVVHRQVRQCCGILIKEDPLNRSQDFDWLND